MITPPLLDTAAALARLDALDEAALAKRIEHGDWSAMNDRIPLYDIFAITPTHDIWRTS